MASIKISETELDALEGMGDLSYRMYMELRRWMDFKTGVVGRVKRISWQAIAEWVYGEPRPGVKAVVRRKSTLRRAKDQLVKRGLLREIGTDLQLVFLCPLADTDSCVRKKADTGSTHQESAAKASAGKPSKAYPQHPKKSKADTHPNTGKTYYPPTPLQGAEQIQPPTPAAREGEPDPRVRRRRQRLSEQPCRDTGDVGEGPAAPHSEMEPKGPLAWEEHLAWPTGLSPHQRSMVARAVRPLGEKLAQQAIDEWRGAVQAGRVDSPFKLLWWIAREAAKPGWLPDHAPDVAAARERARQILQAQQEADQAYRAGIPSSSGPLPRGTLAQLVRPRVPA